MPAFNLKGSSSTHKTEREREYAPEGLLSMPNRSRPYYSAAALSSNAEKNCKQGPQHNWSNEQEAQQRSIAAYSRRLSFCEFAASEPLAIVSCVYSRPGGRVVETEEEMMRAIVVLLQACLMALLVRGQMQQLANSLLTVAGVYSDDHRAVLPFASDSPKWHMLNRTVLVTSCNYGYINHLQNFYCFASRLGLKFVVISMDSRTHEYVNTKMSAASGGKVQSFLWSHGVRVSEQSTNFRSKAFNLVANRKKEASLAVLKLGYHVLFADVDVALVRDPVPLLLWEHVDYVHSVNLYCPMAKPFNYSETEGNTGFYFARSNSKNIKMWEASLANSPKFPNLDDQTIFWQTMRESTSPRVHSLTRCDTASSSSSATSSSSSSSSSTASSSAAAADNEVLVACALDECVFSSGMVSNNIDAGVPKGTTQVLQQELQKRRKEASSIHANFMVGNDKKRESLRAAGLWLANDASPNIACKPFSPTF